MLFTDDYNRMVWVYFLEKKSEALNKFKQFKAKVEPESGQGIMALRSDRGGEFCSNEYHNFCLEQVHTLRSRMEWQRKKQDRSGNGKKHATRKTSRRFFLGRSNCYIRVPS
jgi:hypothetical protein